MGNMGFVGPVVARVPRAPADAGVVGRAGQGAVVDGRLGGDVPQPALPHVPAAGDAQRHRRSRPAALQRATWPCRSSSRSQDDDQLLPERAGRRGRLRQRRRRRARVAARRAGVRPRRLPRRAPRHRPPLPLRASAPRGCLVIESAGYVRTPNRYRNEFGQLMEHAPFSERDIRRPSDLQTIDQKGEFPIVVKKDNRLTRVVRRPPSLRRRRAGTATTTPGRSTSTTSSRGSGACTCRRRSTRPSRATGSSSARSARRPYDFDPAAVPVPYVHSNVMSDEVLYYASAEFMSRKGIEYGSITLHPDGVPHGPHPGRTEASLGARETNELAVMVDTFRPLRVAKDAAGDRGRATTTVPGSSPPDRRADASHARAERPAAPASSTTRGCFLPPASTWVDRPRLRRLPAGPARARCSGRSWSPPRGCAEFEHGDSSALGAGGGRARRAWTVQRDRRRQRRHRRRPRAAVHAVRPSAARRRGSSRSK